MVNKGVKEEKIVAASYIVSFYQQVDLLTHTYSQYSNLLIELESKYGEQLIVKMSVEENNLVTQAVQQVRYYCHRCYVQYRCIIENIDKGKKELEDVEKLYEAVKQDFIIVRSNIEKFVIKLNSVLIKSVMKNLLETSQEVLGNIYGEE